ncbi:putative membrane protein YdjX (TVP38/TMEM64 family) [Algoriphagus ratkowskyi]|uniref:TVP38/TMEM64 family membrane protein n=1 Tax=Algoriphagus ratkowskyi TaxID=57028 RepID=A0A2W7QYL0_9BACT|nr:VTT domain-containing protein [Algoriphagus ratkowskyi]PZX53384.1 putative membrane protein YdjX (TVP38/TMEM64 family) [Algoriphagus ratkowskyi]TXD76570.1 VTT domain-containing protein [Algoriphagus ratkowskyi]
MTKKGRIFKTIRRYFGKHPAGIFAWLWITAMPFVGSLIFATNYDFLEQYQLLTPLDYFIYTTLGALLMGLAFLPTTLIAIASGFYFGWSSLLFLVIGYSLGSVLGYALGKFTNLGFTELLFRKNPKFHREIEARKEKEGSLVFFVRISPIVPFAVSNFLFASMNIKLWKVLVYGIPGMLTRTVLAFAAGVLASSYLAAKESMNSPLQWGIGIALLIIGVAGIYGYVKKKR